MFITIFVRQGFFGGIEKFTGVGERGGGKTYVRRGEKHLNFCL